MKIRELNQLETKWPPWHNLVCW